MSDNIFNYFSNKGTRKVDPIDDAEFNSIDAPPTPEDPPSQSANPDSVQGSATEVAAADGSPTPMSMQSSQSSPPESSQSSGTKSVEPTPKKSQSNWDFLANMLGIKKDPPPVATEEKRIAGVSEKQEKQVPAPPEKTKPASASPFGSLPKEIAKEEVILSSMFVPTSSSADSEGDAKSSFDQTEFSDEDSASEYVEFEVEDLDKTADGDDTDRKSRRSFSRINESRSRDDQNRPRGERDRQPLLPRHDTPRNSDSPRKSASTEPQSRDRQGRAPQERQSRERQSRETHSRETHSRDRQNREPQNRDRQGRDRQPRDAQARDRHVREDLNPAGQKQRELGPESENNQRRDQRPERDVSRRAPAAQAPDVDSSFGSGIFDDAPERSEVRFDEDAPRRKRRRRRGRDSSSTESAPSSLPRHSPLPDVDPPDEFFDEVGWQPAHAQRHHRSESSDSLIEDDFESSLEGDAEFPAASENAAGDRPVRKRRRRRPRGRRDSSDLDPATSADSNFENRPAPAREPLDDDEDEFDYDQAHRNPRQPRQAAATGRNVDRKTDDEARTSDEHPKKDRKFPTWEEAISVLVESNIKNHSRSSGQNRSGGNRGRRRR